MSDIEERIEQGKRKKEECINAPTVDESSMNVARSKMPNSIEPDRNRKQNMRYKANENGKSDTLI